MGYFVENNLGNRWLPDYPTQKFLNVQYDCVSTLESTTTTTTTTSTTTTTTTQMKNSCAEIMMSAFNFYKKLQASIESAKSHSGKFKHISRMEIFESNMLKWGNKLTKHGCNCDKDLAEDISNSTSLADYENVNYLMTGMADELTCDSRTKNMRNAVNRKVAHAKQILAGVGPND